jgi:hypothetical protein
LGNQGKKLQDLYGKVFIATIMVRACATVASIVSQPHIRIMSDEMWTDNILNWLVVFVLHLSVFIPLLVFVPHGVFYGIFNLY